MKFYAEKINFGLVRLFQLIFAVFFSLLVLTYYGALLMVPLFLIIEALPLLEAAFAGGGVVIFIMIAILVYVASFLYYHRGIFDLIFETGKELIQLGRTQYSEFEQVIQKIKS